MIVFLTRDFKDYPKNKIDLPEDKSWSIYDKIDTIELMETECEKIVIPNNDEDNYEDTVRILVLPFHRFSKNYYTMILENKSYTLYELLNIIYKFYNEKRLTYLELKSLDSDDVYEYIDNKCLHLKENPHAVINPIDIIGDKTFFQGIYYEEDNVGDIQYTLSLGS